MIKKIFFKLFLALLPIIILVVFYLIADPFMVLRHYDNLYSPTKKHLELNEEYVATESLLKLYPTEKYDSYIFGSSRSRYYTPEEWEKRISPINAFGYGVAMESLYGISGKINFLHERNMKINNAILVLDASLLAEATNRSGHLFRKHPLISGESWLDFQFVFLIDFFNFTAISSYINTLTSTDTPGGDSQKLAETQIQENRDAYYNARKEIFYERDTVLSYSKPVIGEEQKKLLLIIKKVFDEDNTNYRIVISPLYDQKKFSAADMDVLTSIFDKNKIFDFSGINDITASKYNYFERVHYRPSVTNKILDTIYTQPL